MPLGREAVFGEMDQGSNLEQRALEVKLYPLPHGGLPAQTWTNWTNMPLEFFGGSERPNNIREEKMSSLIDTTV